MTEYDEVRIEFVKLKSKLTAMITRAFFQPAFIIWMSCASAILFLNPAAHAQRAPGDVGIGIHLGQPTGLTLKVYSPGTSVDFLAAWDLDDFFFLNIHAMYDVHLNNERTIHFFYGPGGYVGIRDRGRELDDEVELGVSGNFGFDFLIQKFEIFLQATPRLSLVQSTNFDMGGGAGFRLYF